jgi:hypothetical protein
MILTKDCFYSNMKLMVFLKEELIIHREMKLEEPELWTTLVF